MAKVMVPVLHGELEKESGCGTCYGLCSSS
jgi:hypothetical protein